MPRPTRAVAGDPVGRPRTGWKACATIPRVEGQEARVVSKKAGAVGFGTLLCTVGS